MIFTCPPYVMKMLLGLMDDLLMHARVVVEFVRVVQTVGDARAHECDDLRRETQPSLFARFPDRGQRLTEEQLHRNEELSLLTRLFVDLDDGRVREPADELRFVEEHRHELHVAGVLGTNDLQRDDRMFGVVRASEIDDRHAAFGDLGANSVATEAREGQLVGRARGHGRHFGPMSSSSAATMFP
jgi:hypothetical protein